MDDRLRLFISYSRADMTAADALVDELEKQGFQALIDRRDLPYGEEWQIELGDFIRSSDAVLWLVSPDSVHSKWCNWELGEVARLNKRLIPIRIREVQAEDLPEALGKVHFLPASGVFDASIHLPALVDALNRDSAWLKDATRLADRARQWIAKGRDTGLLLRGAALADAEAWTVRHRGTSPPPASEVLELILASRRGQIRRQQVAVALSLAGAVVGIGLAVTAVIFARQAQEQTAVAQANERRAVEQEQKAKTERDNVLIGRSRFLADQSRQKLAQGDSTGAVLTALEALPDPNHWEDRFATPEAEKSLLAAVYRNRELFRTRFVKHNPPTSTKDGLIALADASSGAAIVLSSDTGRVRWRQDSLDDRPVAVEGFSPQGDALMTIAGNAVNLWDRRQTVSIKAASPRRAVFCPDSRRIAVDLFHFGSAERIEIVDTASQRRIATLETDFLIGDFFCDPQGVHLIQYDQGNVNVWDTESGRHIGGKRCTPLDGGPRISADGRYILCPDIQSARDLLLWDVKTGVTSVLKGGGRLSAWLFSLDGLSVVAGDEDGLIQIWRTKDRHLVESIRNGGGVTSLDVRQRKGGPLSILVGSSDGTTRIWDAEGGVLLGNLQGHSTAIVAAEFAPLADDDSEADNGFSDALTADKNGVIRVWDISDPNQPKQRYQFKLDGSRLTSAKFVGRGVIATSKENIVQIWSRRGREENLGAPPLAYTRDGRRIARGDLRKGVIVSDPKSGDQLSVLPMAFADRVERAAFAADGSKMVTVSRSRRVIFWEVEGAKVIASFQGPDTQADTIAVSADGRFVAILFDGVGVRVYDWSGGAVADLASLGTDVRSVALSPDGATAALAIRGEEILAPAELILAELPGGRPAARMKGPDLFSDLAFSPDGAALFASSSSSAGSIIHRWVLKTLEHSTSAPFHLDGYPPWIAVDPAGTRLVYGDAMFDATSLELLWLGDESDRRAIGAALTDVGAISLDFGKPVVQPFFINSRDLALYARGTVPACLAPDERRPPLDPAPPDWCITGSSAVAEADPKKWVPFWPYQTSDWKDWLIAKRAGGNPTRPSAP